MERRDFVSGLGAMTVGALVTNEGIRQAGAAGNSALRVVAGIRIVDTRIAKAADGLSQSVSARYLYNHAMRTYLFGALIGRAEGLTFDEELLYLASVLHDLGLTERFMGAKPFELEGALAAENIPAGARIAGHQGCGGMGWYCNASPRHLAIQAARDQIGGLRGRRRCRWRWTRQNFACRP